MKFRITIQEVTEKEIPETDYQNTHKQDDKGKDIWEYVETRKMITETNHKEIYVQELEDLDLGELAIFINRSR